MKAHQLNVPINGRVRAVLQFLRDQTIKNKVVVDVGSTFGWLAKETEKDNPKKYIGIEPNQESVDFAKKSVKYAEFFQGFAEELPIKDNVADIVVFFDVIEHVQDEQKSLDEIARILKKGGVLLLTTPYDHPITKLTDPAWVLGHIPQKSPIAKLFNESWLLGHRHYKRAQLEKLLHKAGLQIESFEVRGQFVSLLYMFLFYFNKWYFRGKVNLKWLQDLDNKSYENKGIATVFLIARK